MVSAALQPDIKRENREAGFKTVSGINKSLPDPS
jgi:hypothetical protein